MDILTELHKISNSKEIQKSLDDLIKRISKFPANYIVVDSDGDIETVYDNIEDAMEDIEGQIKEEPSEEPPSIYQMFPYRKAIKMVIEWDEE